MSRMRHRNEHGFALVISLSLMAFVLVLLLTITSLAKIESTSSSTAMKKMQAEQNALLALNIAIGQLQKYVGPDQRTTARADLENGTSTSHSHWLGTYGSSIPADYSTPPETIATELSDLGNISSKGSSARLLNWLVSGNETAAFDPNWVSGDVGDKGEITAYPNANTDLNFAPSATVDGLTISSQATDTDITIADTSGTEQPARLLVGGNSVTSTRDSSNVPVDYVVVPAVDIESGNSTRNRYAWWVSDEGMKARINLPLAGSDSSLSTAEAFEERRNAFSNSTREAIELMALDSPNDGSLPALDAARIGSLYPVDASVSSIFSTTQTALISSDSDAMSTALKYRFHDITTASSSVLSDTYAGGLKRDLSILLDESSNFSYATTPSDSTFDSNTLWPRHTDATDDTVAFSDNYGMPTWKHLRSYYQTRVPASGVLEPILPAHDKATGVGGNTDGVEDHVGIAPILTYCSMGFSMGLHKEGAPAGAPAAAGDVIYLKLYPLVVLWNPYNFTIKASEYEVGLYPTHSNRLYVDKSTDGGVTWIDTSGQVDANGDIVDTDGNGIPDKTYSFDFQELPGTSSQSNFTRFRLNSPDIPPGQSLIFSLPASASGDPYDQRNILENIEPNESAYVTVPFQRKTGNGNNTEDTTVLAGDTNAKYRLRVQLDSNGNETSSFKNGGAGGFNMYLGEPDDADNIFADHWLLDPSRGGTGSHQLFNPSRSGDYRADVPTDRRWYNTHQAIDWNGTVADSPLQFFDQLTYEPDDSAAYVFLAQALFSGAGSNARFNPDQYMFTTRWLAQGNMRATRTARSMRDNNFNVLYISTAGSTSQSVRWQKFNISEAAPNRTSAGSGHDVIDTPVDAMLFEFPDEGQDLFSIGQLQHANLSFFGSYPSYPIGNSLADFRLPLKDPSNSKFRPLPAGHQLVRIDDPISPGDNRKGLTQDMNAYYDISYLLNRTLWDRYYFSTVPATGVVPDTLPNPRYLRHSSSIDLQDPDESAAALVMAGGFNINSTSEQAWRAVLGGGNLLDFTPDNVAPASNTELHPSFPRLTSPYGDDDPDNPWTGYRTLDEDQIAQLARNIVTEIRNRGPFVSVADFVNRRIYDNPATGDSSSSTGEVWEHETFRGTIQAAIDRTAATQAGSFASNDANGDFWVQDQLASNTSGDGRHNQTTQYTMGYYDKSQLEGGDIPSKPSGNRSAFAPKYITQADILAKIGANLSARSDTFTIRTYGETVNSVTNAVDAQAWCEATVQRLPEYFDSGANAASAAPSELTPLNKAFGRQFKILSLKWLSSNDI